MKMQKRSAYDLRRAYLLQIAGAVTSISVFFNPTAQGGCCIKRWIGLHLQRLLPLFDQFIGHRIDKAKGHKLDQAWYVEVWQVTTRMPTFSQLVIPGCFGHADTMPACFFAGKWKGVLNAALYETGRMPALRIFLWLW